MKVEFFFLFIWNSNKNEIKLKLEAKVGVFVGPLVQFSKTKLLHCLLSAGYVSSAVTGAVGGVIKSYSKYGAVSFISSYEDFIYIYVIVWEVRIGKNCDRGLENAARVFYNGFVYATLSLNRLTRRLRYKPFAKTLTSKRANKSNTKKLY